MTIGDEKVRRYEPMMIGIEDRPHEAGMYADLHGHYVLQSAYAELAADRDLWRSMATFEGKVSASALDDLHTTQAQLAEERELRMSLESSWQQAEAQLAELRGKLEGLAVKWQRAGLIAAGTKHEHFANELRTLAAADGATTGEMK